MATKITTPVSRETTTTVKGRNLIIELHAGYFTLRQKGLKQPAVMVPYDAAYDLGRKLAARL